MWINLWTSILDNLKKKAFDHYFIHTTYVYPYLSSFWKLFHCVRSVSSLVWRLSLALIQSQFLHRDGFFPGAGLRNEQSRRLPESSKTVRFPNIIPLEEHFSLDLDNSQLMTHGR